MQLGILSALTCCDQGRMGEMNLEEGMDIPNSVLNRIIAVKEEHVSYQA